MPFIDFPNKLARYFSPYPISDEEESQHLNRLGPRIPGVSRTTIRSHGRTSELLAGGLHRHNSDGRKADLYVCDMCFKYMTDSVSWEVHKVIELELVKPGTKFVRSVDALSNVRQVAKSTNEDNVQYGK